MSTFNKEPIDIVIPWVNSDDAVWQKDFLYWSGKETGNKDRCRIRDLGQLRYILRSIEQNCPWCRYVFLILYGPSQIPKWLNTKCPRLKIVYHKDFIPEELLPTFNSFVMDMNLHRIKELSENFIFCNDDMLFLKGLKETDFFKNDRPQFPFNYLKKGTYNAIYNKFDKTLKNVFNFIKDVFGVNMTLNGMWHMPIPLKKSLYEFMWSKYENEFMNSLRGSKFRQSKNLFNWLFFYIEQIKNVAENHQIKRNYINLKNNTPIKIFQALLSSTGLGCINDNEGVQKSAEGRLKSAIKATHEKQFKKSSFEL